MCNGIPNVEADEGLDVDDGGGGGGGDLAASGVALPPRWSSCVGDDSSRDCSSSALICWDSEVPSCPILCINTSCWCCATNSSPLDVGHENEELEHEPSDDTLNIDGGTPPSPESCPPPPDEQPGASPVPPDPGDLCVNTCCFMLPLVENARSQS